MKLEKVLKNKNKFNKIEKKLIKLNKGLEIKFYIFTFSHFIILPAFFFLIGFSNSMILTLFASFVSGIVLIFINAFIWSLFYKKSDSLSIFDFYNSKSEKFSNKYYEYLKLKKRKNIYFENLLYSIQNSNIEQIINCEDQLKLEIENFKKDESKVLIKLITEKLNDKKEKENLIKLFEEKRCEVQKKVLMEI